VAGYRAKLHIHAQHVAAGRGRESATAPSTCAFDATATAIHRSARLPRRFAPATTT
jgi:hypothetical protein